MMRNPNSSYSLMKKINKENVSSLLKCASKRCISFAFKGELVLIWANLKLWTSFCIWNASVQISNKWTDSELEKVTGRVQGWARDPLKRLIFKFVWYIRDKNFQCLTRLGHQKPPDDKTLSLSLSLSLSPVSCKAGLSDIHPHSLAGRYDTPWSAFCQRILILSYQLSWSMEGEYVTEQTLGVPLLPVYPVLAADHSRQGQWSTPQ